LLVTLKVREIPSEVHHFLADVLFVLIQTYIDSWFFIVQNSVNEKLRGQDCLSSSGSTGEKDYPPFGQPSGQQLIEPRNPRRNSTPKVGIA